MELQTNNELNVEVAREAGRAEVLSVYGNLHLTTVADLRKNGPTVRAYVVAGRAPYLVSLESIREGVWPFHSLPESIDTLAADTLVAWR
jgi:hypothetical protein